MLKCLLINCVLINYLVETCPSSCSIQTYKPYLQKINHLAKYPNSKKLGNLALIGTHSSLSYHSSIEVVRTQELNLAQQLKYGIRVLDIAVHPKSVFFEIYGEYNKNLGILFQDVLKELFFFLDENPSEFMIILMHQANIGTADSSLDNCVIIDYHIKHFLGGYLLTKNWTLEDPIKKHRGKILLASYDESFRECAFNVETQCMSQIDKVPLKFVVIQNMIDKWKYINQIIKKSFLREYGCYINDISYDDSVNNRRVIAKDGGYEFRGQCVRPINELMAKNFRNPYTALVIVLADYVTQELIDAVSDIHFQEELLQ